MATKCRYVEIQDDYIEETQLERDLLMRRILPLGYSISVSRLDFALLNRGD